MPLNAIIEMHKGIVYLFLLSLTIKIGLMLFKPELFQVVRAKTKVVEMILGTLLLLSGLWVWKEYNGFSIQSWIFAKIIIMFAGTGLAIVGLKKGNKLLAILGLTLFVGLFIYMTKIHH